MEDGFETKVLSEVVSSHYKLCRRYMASFNKSLASVVASEVNFHSLLKKPFVFMLAVFLFILLSIFIQSKNDKVKKLLSCLSGVNAYTPRVLLRPVSEPSTTGVTSHTGRNVVEKLTDGAVGVYAMQGRRPNMEDRFSVMQHVDVGSKDSMSFFGVFDGHGGQYVAEYLRLHLFDNIIAKLREIGEQVRVEAPVALKLTDTIEREDSANYDNDPPMKDCQETLENEIFRDLRSGAQCADSSTRKSEGLFKNEEVSMKKNDVYSNIAHRKKSLAEKASAIVPDTEAETHSKYLDVNRNINYTKLLTDEILSLDAKVLQHCRKTSDYSGSTAIIAMLHGGRLIVANVGDSRAVMCDTEGRAIPLSFDHKPNQLKERRRVKAAGGFVHFTGVWRVNGVLAVSRALGDLPLKVPLPLVSSEPDVLSFGLQEHKAEFILLASDGLWDVMTNEEACRYVRERLSLNEPDYGAKSLARKAWALGSGDNVTVLVIRV